MAMGFKRFKWHFPIQKILYFFKTFVPCGIFLNIMDGHGSHVTLEAIKQVQQIGLHIITFFSHTSHVLQLYALNIMISID
jgi:hypothetical protein